MSACSKGMAALSLSLPVLACGARSDPLDENARGAQVVDCSACPDEVFVGDAVIRTQADADAMSDFGEIDGKLTIEGGGVVSDLSGLECVGTVSKAVLVDDTFSLPTMEGFDCLRSVGTRLRLRNLDGLESVDGLERLSSVGTGMILRDLPGLANLSGFESLRRVGGNLTISNVPKLPSCDAAALVDQLTELGGTVTLEDTLPDSCGP